MGKYLITLTSELSADSVLLRKSCGDIVQVHQEYFPVSSSSQLMTIQDKKPSRSSAAFFKPKIAEKPESLELVFPREGSLLPS